MRDLNIQLEDVKNQMYTIKSERNQLMIENHNLREENKDLAQQLTAVDGKCQFLARNSPKAFVDFYEIFLLTF